MTWLTIPERLKKKLSKIRTFTVKRKRFGYVQRVHPRRSLAVSMASSKKAWRTRKKMARARAESMTERTDRTELEILRLSVQRVAESTGDADVIAAIPGSTSADRGWNRLCAFLCDWAEANRDKPDIKAMRAERDRALNRLMTARQQNERILATIRQLYDEVRAEQTRETEGD